MCQEIRAWDQKRFSNDNEEKKDYDKIERKGYSKKSAI